MQKDRNGTAKARNEKTTRAIGHGSRPRVGRPEAEGQEECRSRRPCGLETKLDWEQNERPTGCVGRGTRPTDWAEDPLPSAATSKPHDGGHTLSTMSLLDHTRDSLRRTSRDDHWPATYSIHRAAESSNQDFTGFGTILENSRATTRHGGHDPRSFADRRSLPWYEVALGRYLPSRRDRFLLGFALVRLVGSFLAACSTPSTKRSKSVVGCVASRCRARFRSTRTVDVRAVRRLDG